MRRETRSGVHELQSGWPKIENSRWSGSPVPSHIFCQAASGVAGASEQDVRPVSASGWKKNMRHRCVRSGFSSAQRMISGTKSTLRPVTVQLWANSRGRPVRGPPQRPGRRRAHRLRQREVPQGPHPGSLGLDLERLDAALRERPIVDAASFLAADALTAELRLKHPLVADESVDVVVSNCVLNLVDARQKGRLFEEIFRVLRVGGRAVIPDIVSDEPSPEHLQNDPEL